MKLTDKTKTILIIIIAFIMIGMGLVQALFKVELEKEVVDQVSFVLMMIAAGLFFSKKRGRIEKEENTADESTTEESDNEKTPNE